jgi:hypothetical protein
MPTTTANATEICTLALQSIGFAGAGASSDISPEDMNFAFQILNGMLDALSMDRLFIFNVDFTEFALTSGQQNYGIGPNSTTPFNLAVRPSRIVSAQLRLNTSPLTYVMLNQLDDDGWARLPVVDIPPTYPTAFYYSPSWPDGLLRLWGKPQGGLAIRLELWNQFAQFADLLTAYSFPQGYYEFMWSNLAEHLCTPAFGLNDVPSSIRQRATDSRARIVSLNMSPPGIMICDAGAQGVRQNTGYRNLFNPSPIWYSNGS